MAMFAPNGVQVAYQSGERASVPRGLSKPVAGLDMSTANALPSAFANRRPESFVA